ncbi:MAG: SMP-30/gluconolactonase/LRE family protein [Parvularculaceae bacterium]|nr:SMP-30/gluconolactonase/LRE family protein [Parvularculaceae bacterium]
MRFSLLAGGLALLFVMVGGAAVFTLHHFNHFAQIEDRFDGVCQPVSGVAGPEDIEVALTRDRAFISSMDRHAGADARGAIYSVVVSDPLDSDNWRDRTGGVPENFRPLGLSYYEAGNTRRLFVVNEAGRSVDIFDVGENGDLTFAESVSERRLTSPNDVVAVGPRSFYVTNDVAAGRGSMLGRFQFLSRSSTGAVYHFDGVSMRVAAEGLRFANGIAVNQRGTRLYVAESSGQAIKIFDRDPESSALSFSRYQNLPASPDNITVAWDGSVWVGAQPKPLALPLAEQSEKVLAPSLVIRFTDNDGAAASISEVFSSTGAAISTASVAAISGGKLLIGALFDSKYLICDLPS